MLTGPEDMAMARLDAALYHPPTVAKHRNFTWLDRRICPDRQPIVIARDDDTTFGILQSQFYRA